MCVLLFFLYFLITFKNAYSISDARLKICTRYFIAQIKFQRVTKSYFTSVLILVLDRIFKNFSKVIHSYKNLSTNLSFLNQHLNDVVWMWEVLEDANAALSCLWNEKTASITSVGICASILASNNTCTYVRDLWPCKLARRNQSISEVIVIAYAIYAL